MRYTIPLQAQTRATAGPVQGSSKGFWEADALGLNMVLDSRNSKPDAEILLI